MSESGGAAKPAEPGPSPPTEPYGIAMLLRGGFRALWDHRRAFCVAAALPFLLLMLRHLGTPPAELASSDDPAALRALANAHGKQVVIGSLLRLAASVLMAVAWHRLLLGYERPGLLPRFGRWQLRYLGRFLLLGLLPFAILLAMGVTAVETGVATGPEHEVPGAVIVIGLLALGGVTYLVLRWSLVLPAASVMVRVSFRESWVAMRGKVLPLFVAPLVGSLILWLPVALVFFVLGGLGTPDAAVVPGDGHGSDHGGGTQLVVRAATTVLFLLEVALFAGMLSLAAMRLIPDPPAAERAGD